MSHADHAGHDDMSGMTMTTKAPAAAAAGKEPAMDPAMDHSNHGGSTGSSSSDAMAGMGHMAMRPYLFSETTGFYVLFKEALVGSTGSFVGALFAVFAFGALTTIGFEFGKRLEMGARRSGGGPVKIALGALGHGLKLFLHYMAMLLVMTMNIWIIIAVLLGHMAGFLAVSVLGIGKSKAVGKTVDGSDEITDGVGCSC